MFSQYLQIDHYRLLPNPYALPIHVTRAVETVLLNNSTAVLWFLLPEVVLNQ
jgi:hypothetical protein